MHKLYKHTAAGVVAHVLTDITNDVTSAVIKKESKQSLIVGHQLRRTACLGRWTVRLLHVRWTNAANAAVSGSASATHAELHYKI